jgi:iron(III) transport system ATP-binding protein
MLKVDRLTKVYQNAKGGPAGGISDASFHLETGDFFTLLGPSGCGKTTTLRCIAGLNEPDTGAIRVGDKVLFDSAGKIAVPLHQRNIGMVFQSYAIWPHMTVGENVSFPMRVARKPKFSRAEIAEATLAALRSVGLEGYADRSATKLSGGQQQRVAFARAIVMKPKLLLLDEPLSNLDASLRESMRLELKRLQKETGITAVYVTHDQTEALAMSDKIAVINDGRIEQIGPPRDIYFRPENEFVAGFIGNTNILRGKMLEAERGEGRVDIGDGKILRCSVAIPADRGATVALTIRPENIEIRAGQAATDACCANALAGRVASVSFLGNVMHYLVALKGQHMVQVEGRPDVAFEIGDEVALQFHPRHTIAVRSRAN